MRSRGDGRDCLFGGPLPTVLTNNTRNRASSLTLAVNGPVQPCRITSSNDKSWTAFSAPTRCIGHRSEDICQALWGPMVLCFQNCRDHPCEECAKNRLLQLGRVQHAAKRKYAEACVLASGDTLPNAGDHVPHQEPSTVSYRIRAANDR